jgi:hypothetical protein
MHWHNKLVTTINVRLLKLYDDLLLDDNVNFLTLTLHENLSDHLNPKDKNCK